MKKFTEILNEKIDRSEFVDGFNFYMVNADGVSRFKVTGKKELNIGEVALVKQTKVAGKPKKQDMVGLRIAADKALRSKKEAVRRYNMLRFQNE